MSKNMVRMLGIWMMILSVFFIMAGLFIKDESINNLLTKISLVVGLSLLVIGVIFYKILKSNE